MRAGRRVVARGVPRVGGVVLVLRGQFLERRQLRLVLEVPLHLQAVLWAEEKKESSLNQCNLSNCGGGISVHYKMALCAYGIHKYGIDVLLGEEMPDKRRAEKTENVL